MIYEDEPHCACGADDHDDSEHPYVDDEEMELLDL